MAHHDVELRKRYREIDFVAEFQKYWAYFNKWFKEETQQTTDRDAVEALKANSKIKIIIQNLLNEGQEQLRFFDFDSHDLTAYLTENLVSSFVKYSWLCSVIKNSLNLFNPNIVNHVRGTGTIYLTLQEYRKIYSIGRKIEALPVFMDQESFRMSELFRYVGITYVGSCF